MTKCKHPILVAVEDEGHDINIFDIEHDDNYITLTRDEAKYVLKRLKEIL